MTPRQAIDHLRTTIVNQGPDTPNRHYGRAQWQYLIDCLDTLEPLIDGAADPLDLLTTLAGMQFEVYDDTDELVPLFFTADDIASRLRGRLRELGYWWKS